MVKHTNILLKGKTTCYSSNLAWNHVYLSKISNYNETKAFKNIIKHKKNERICSIVKYFCIFEEITKEIVDI